MTSSQTWKTDISNDERLADAERLIKDIAIDIVIDGMRLTEATLHWTRKGSKRQETNGI